MKKIILTGGGTAGHVNGNLALLPRLRKEGYEIKYIGSRLNIERELIAKEKDIEYFIISSGMLRRYFDLKNVTDIFRVLKGVIDTIKILKKEKPDVIFSKGGFVTVPVAIAAKICKVPYICHESDLSPGLANKISSRFSKHVLVTFPETLASFPNNGILVGSPVREELFTGDKKRGLDFLKFNNNKPILLAMGGSLGSPLLNNAIWNNLDNLLKKYNIVHHVGQDFFNDAYENIEGYRQFTYINEELKDILMATDMVISRAGSNSIFEFLALKIPNLLIPLGLESSRGDQIENAESFKKMGFSQVLQENEVTSESLENTLDSLYQNKEEYIERMDKAKITSSVSKIMEIIDKATVK